MIYRKGDVVVVKFPFRLQNGNEVQKGRPAVVLFDERVKRRYNDVILAAITSQLPSEIMELEIVLEPSVENGLLKKSLLRLDYLMTIPEDLISRKIGRLTTEILNKCEFKLKTSFGLE